MALTKVSGDILDTGIVVAGVVTATSFDGPITGNVTGSATSISGTPDITVRNISGVGATFTGNVSIGGTLTYQDVTNVDSTGIATARVGLDILSGGLNIVGLTTGLHVSGVSTFTGAINGNVTGNISGGTVAGSTGTFSGDVSIADKIIHTGDTDTAIRFPAADTISFETGGDEKLRIKSNGFVGIGTNNPSRFLHVQDGSNTLLALDSTDTNADLVQSDTGGSTLIRSSSGALDFFTGGDASSTNATNAGKRITIDTSGHIIPGAAGTQDLGSTSKEFRNLYLGDVGSVYFGLGQDVRAYYDPTGSASFTIDSTAGYMYINSDALRLNSKTSGWSYIRGDKSDGVVKLYKSNSVKLVTSDTGISVTGEVAASQDYPNYRPTLDFNFAAVKKLDPRITYQRTGPASYTDEFGKVVLVGDNVPRFDHDPVTRESKGLLIEESRTNNNKCVMNQWEFTGWSDSNFNREHYPSETAPDGLTNTTLVYPNTNNSNHYIYVSHAGNGLTGVRTCSAWFKKLSTTTYFPQLRIFGVGSGKAHAVFTLTGDGSVSSGGSSKTAATITPYPDGWYRCTLSWDHSGGHYGGGIIIGNDSSTELPSFVGDTDKTKGFLVWGFQDEAGAFPTSLIPTNGSTATRGNDLCQITGQEFSDFYNQTEGTIVTEHNIATGVAAGDNTYVYQIDDGSDTNVGWRLLDHNSAHGDLLRAYGFVGGSWGSPQYGFDSATPAHNTFLKVALGMKNNDFGVNFFGGTTATDTSGSVTGNGDMTQLTIGNHRGGTAPLQGYIRRFIYYPQKLTTNQLKTITS